MRGSAVRVRDLLVLLDESNHIDLPDDELVWLPQLLLLHDEVPSLKVSTIHAHS